MSIWFKDKLFHAVNSVPFVMFTFMSIIYLYLMQNAQLFFWDEYSHWGAFIKEMYYFHYLYDASSIASNLIYPPGISLWNYFIVLPSGFYEGKLYFAYFLILFSSTLMMYEKLLFKDVHWIVLVFTIQMVMFASFGHGFSSLYVDHVIGAMFAGLILAYFVDNFSMKQFILFGFPLSAIVLVKEIGLYFGVAFIGLILILEITRSKMINAKSLVFNIKEKKQIIFILFSLVLIMLFILKFWGDRQESLGIHKPAHSISKVVENIILQKEVFEEDKNIEYKKRFMNVILSQQVHKEKLSLNYNEFSYGIMPKYKSVIKLSTVGSFIFFLFLCIGIYFSIYGREKKNEILIIGSYMLLISIVYLFILYLSFPLTFGNRALQMVSYVRYMNMDILPLLLVGFSLMLPMFYEKDHFKKKVRNKLQLFFVSTGMIIILAFIVQPYFKPLYAQLENGFRKNIDRVTENIVKVIPEKSTIFVVFPVKNNGSLNNILRYALIPVRATISSNEFTKKTSKEMMNVFAQYEYVWFASLNKGLINKNRSFLRRKSTNEIFTLYKIEKTNNLLQFKPII